MNAAPMTSETRLTMVIDELTLAAPEVALALVVALAAAELVAEALTVAMAAGVVVAAAAGVATAAAELAPAAGTTLAPAIAAETVELKVPVMPVRVNLAEKEV